MGWFWAESSIPPRLVAPHKISHSEVTPPPGCPMHQTSLSSTPPYPPSNSSKQQSNLSSCPVATSDTFDSFPDNNDRGTSKLNPLNYMPSLSQEKAAHQKRKLPTDRTTSSIPRGDAGENWQYPSPQQMYNAMLRKGHDDTPEDAVEGMVAVHNFLNEGAWDEIINWEARFSRGLGHGWSICRLGEEDGAEELQDFRWQRGEEPRLSRFIGRPKDATPKAQMLQMLGWIWPWKYAGDPPFDRHDWFVQRKTITGQEEVRYVIDYYSGPTEPTGEPVFYLDVRPAVDGPTAACERLMRWGGDVWYRASGAKVRPSTPKAS